MPVTARLSKKFYDKFGDEITGELVSWFNQVDTTYRTQLRELNDRNFERFDNKLEMRLSQVVSVLRAEIQSESAALRNGTSKLRTELKGDIAELRTELKGDIAELRTELKGDIAGLRIEIAQTRGNLIKWMFVFWTGTTATSIGTTFALLKFLG
jgi:hypothetical protein